MFNTFSFHCFILLKIVVYCASAGARTQNPMIKSHLLCQLSYKSIIHIISGVERIKGLEPSTFSLEDWRSANWVIFALKTFSCLWGEFYRKKRLRFFRPTWPTNYTITPLKDTCNALPFELQSASRHGQIRTDNLYMFLVGPVGIEPTKFPSCKDGGLNLLAYGPIKFSKCQLQSQYR